MAGYNQYVGMTINGVLQPVVQLNSTGVYSGLSWPMSEYLSGVKAGMVDAAIVAMISDIPASNPPKIYAVYVGYGITVDEMVAANRYKLVANFSA